MPARSGCSPSCWSSRPPAGWRRSPTGSVTCPGRWRSCSAPRSARPTRRRPPASPAGSACRGGWSPSWKERRCSTTPRRWCSTPRPWPPPPPGTSRPSTPPARSCTRPWPAGAIGLAVGLAGRWLRNRIDDPPIEIAGSILLAYAAYLPAEAIHASGVLAAVTAGLYLGWHSSGGAFSARSRLQSGAFWQTLVFLLNAALFVLVGLVVPHLHRAGPRPARAAGADRDRRRVDRHRACGWPGCGRSAG